MSRIIEHRETVTLSARDLELAVLGYLKDRLPTDYDEFGIIALNRTQGDHGVPTEHRLSGVNELRVVFSYCRSVD